MQYPGDSLASYSRMRGSQPSDLSVVILLTRILAWTYAALASAFSTFPATAAAAAASSSSSSSTAEKVHVKEKMALVQETIIRII